MNAINSSTIPADLYSTKIYIPSYLHSAILTFHHSFILTFRHSSRYIVVCHHTYGARWCSVERAKLTVCLTAVATVLFCLPNYIIYTTMLVGQGSRGQGR